MKVNKKIIIIIFVVFAMTIIMANISNADDSGIDTYKYKDIYKSDGDTDIIIDKSGSILGIVQTIGIGIAVIMLSIMGVKYMIASVEEKAKLKEQLIPYVIGSILLFGGSGLLGIIINWVNELN